MTAWEKLLAASRLGAGTAWELISDTKTGGGVIVSDGIAVDLESPAIDVEVTPMQVEVVIETQSTEVELTPVVIVAEVSTEPIEVEIPQ